MKLVRKVMRTRGYVCALVLLIFFGLPKSPCLVTHAQELGRQDNLQATAKTQRQSLSQDDGTRRIRALRVSEPIKIDGRLDEAVWSQAQSAGEFRQEEPNEGTPATEKTEVRVLFDEKNLYVGIHAFDSEPARINSRELVRDADFLNDDQIQILLDTYHDRRNGYRFTVNPLGTQQDALITDEGRDINLSWDAPWVSAGRTVQTGWTVEIAIPLTTLRFIEGADVWGLNISRIIRRKNEQDLWTSWQRSFGLERVSQAGELLGVEEIQRRRLVAVKPYASGGWREGAPVIGGPGFDAGVQAKAGLEVAKIGITPSLTAEFTANPDFGQAEVDSQIVNLTRFSVFFPEKRDFFLENAGVFLFGRAEANQLFFSRRIGLTDDGAPVPIDYGAKVTGKIGRYNVGLLQVQTRKLGVASSGFEVPRQQFTVARIKRDILKRSSIGGIFVNRQGATSSGGTRYNRGAGVDAEFNLTDHYLIKGFLMGTATPGVRSSFLSGRVDSRFENNLFRFITVYEDIGSNFNPEVGFVERNGIHQYFGQLAYKPRPRFIPHVLQMEFETQIEYYTDRRGKLATKQIELSWDTQFKNSSDFFFRPIEDVTDVLNTPFEIRRGIVIPPGTYHFNRPRVSFTSDSSKRLILTGRYKWGDFYSGKRDEFSGGLTFRPNEHLLFDFTDSFNNVRLPQGNFTTNLFAGRLNYNFSRKLLTSALMQLNSAARISTINFRLRYIYRPNSDLFIIYNQTTGAGLERPSYSFQIKLTRDFTF
ncbi:MAG: carbohydrate binding family 9 domain-containing protein [Acidobacteriota bacterium]|nr:carbohydrate binding family 9 domain-containing protein [Acidobacteriota bacterium]